MSNYVCPTKIDTLFDKNPELGRVEAINWVKSLRLKMGDYIWLPEIGWVEVTAPRAALARHLKEGK